MKVFEAYGFSKGNEILLKSVNEKEDVLWTGHRF